MQPFYYSLVFTISLLSCQSNKVPIHSDTQEPKHPLEAIIEDYTRYEKISHAERQDHWAMYSEEELATDLRQYHSLLGRLEAVDVHDDLNRYIDKSMLTLILKNRVVDIEFGAEQFPLNSEGGFLSGILYSILGQNYATQEEIDRYREKLLALPSYLSAQQELLTQGIQNQKALPTIVIKNCIKLIDHFVQTPIEDNFMVMAVPAEHRPQFIELTRDTVLPAYVLFKGFLAKSYLQNAMQTIGVSNMSGGKTYYEEKIRYFSTLDISPQEVFDKGMSEVARIKKEMDEIIAELDFEGSFADFLEFLRTDEQFYPKSGRELLNRAAWITKEMEGKLPHYFKTLPRVPLAVRPVPDALAPNYTGGRYTPGSFEKKKASQYSVNTYKLESRPYYLLPALSLHEGVPGHHLQIMLAHELEDLPAFRRTYISAFGEGWGLYSEYLGKEAGMYKTPYEQFGALSYEMWRACRLVVDPGMHYFGWTREEAVRFMFENTALSEHEVNTEIDRYIGWPGQAVSYKLGELKFRELRAKAEEKLGQAFDIREFHDTVLRNGSIPLSALEKLVDQYIGETE